MAFIAIGAAALALIGSFWLARLLTEPIDRLSTSLAAMAASHDVAARLPMTGSSRQVDALTETFNALMASVAEAEAQTEAAYTRAIRALAAALDARDPYTAGHSERVSVLSVAIGRTLGLPVGELEVLRLGALLHDIGKIGVPDHVLRKPGALTSAEFAAIREHPVLGALLMVSTDRWDARGAVVNSAPTRPYVIGAATKLRQTPVVEVGGGLTPAAGLRFGAAVAHGRYATPAEIRIPAPDGRTMTMVSGEGEYAFRYTRINGEIVRTSFETLARPAIAYEWFVQGIQTLTPRWFVAARHERASAPPLITGTAVGVRTTLRTVETTAGYRINPDITLRSSYYARKSYNARTWDNQVGFSIVWARRWW